MSNLFSHFPLLIQYLFRFTAPSPSPTGAGPNSSTYLRCQHQTLPHSTVGHTCLQPPCSKFHPLSPLSTLLEEFRDRSLFTGQLSSDPKPYCKTPVLTWAPPLPPAAIFVPLYNLEFESILGLSNATVHSAQEFVLSCLTHCSTCRNHLPPVVEEPHRGLK